MAFPCEIIDIKTGKKYSYAEYKAKLAEGLLEKYIKDEVVVLKEPISEKKEEKPAEKKVEKKAPGPEGITASEIAESEGRRIREDEFGDFVARESENSIELAETYLLDHGKEQGETKLEYNYRRMQEHGITMTEADYRHYGGGGDEKIPASTRRKYINEDALPLDVSTQALGLEPQDAINMIQSEQLGEYKYVETPLKRKLKERYHELFGRDLTPKEAKKVIQDEAKKHIKNYDELLDTEAAVAAEFEKQMLDEIRRGRISFVDADGNVIRERYKEAKERVEGEEDRLASTANKRAQQLASEKGLSTEVSKANREAKRELGDVWEEANNYLSAVDSYTDELLKGEIPKGVKLDVLNAVMLKEQVRLTNEIEATEAELKDIEDSNEMLSQSLISKLRDLEFRLERNINATEIHGTELARGFRARQMLSTLNYSYVNLKRRIENLQGHELSVEQEQLFGNIAKDHAKISKELNDILDKRAKKKEIDKTKENDELIAKIKKEVAAEFEKRGITEPKAKDVSERRKKADKAIKGISSLQSKLRSKAYSDATGIVAIIDTGLTAMKVSIDKGTDLLDAIEQVVSYINKEMKGKSWNEKEFRKDLNEELGIKNEPTFKDLTETTVKKLKEGVKGNESKIKYAVNKMLKALVKEDHALKYDEYVDIIHDTLSKEIKDLSREEVAKMVSGYGEYKELSKGEVETKIREIRTQERLDAALKDTETDKLPLRSGMERHEKSQEARNKERDIARNIKEKGLVPDPTAEEISRQYRSDEEKYQRLLENSIADYDKAIKEGKRRDNSTGRKNYESEKTKQLIEDRDRIKKIHDAKFKDPAKSELAKLIDSQINLNKKIGEAKKEGKVKDEEALKKEKELTEGQISDLTKFLEIPKNDLEKLVDHVVKLNEKISQDKKKGDVKSEEFKLKQKELTEGVISNLLSHIISENYDPIATELARKIEAKREAIDELHDKLDSGDLSKKEIKEGTTSYELEVLRKEHEDLLKELQRRRKEVIPPKTEAEKLVAKEAVKEKATQKAIDEINAKIKSLQKGVIPDGEISVTSKEGKKIFGFKEAPAEKITNKRIEELLALKQHLKDEMSNLLPEAIKNKALIAKELASREKRKANLEAMLAKGEFGKPAPIDKPISNEIAKKNLEIKALEKKVAYEKAKIELKNRTKTEKIIQGLSMWQRSMIFLNPWGIGRLGLAAMYRPIEQPFSIYTNLALSNTPIIKKLMQKSAAAYTPTLKSANRQIKDYYTKLFAKETFKAAWSEYSEISDWELKYGDKLHVKPFESKLAKIIEKPQQTHGVLKSGPKYAKLESAYQNALENLSETVDPKTGEKYDITDIPVQAEALKQAKQAALTDIFMQENEGAKAIAQLVSHGNTSDAAVSKALSLVLSQEMPILKIPHNFFREVFQKIPGIGLADAIMPIKKALSNKEISSESAYKATRALTNNMLGTATVAFGYALYQKYGEDIIKKMKDSGYWLHNSASKLLVMGMEMAAMEEEIPKGEEDEIGKMKAFIDAAAGMSKEEIMGLPITKAARDVVYSLQSKGTLDKKVKEMLAVLLVPAGMEKAARTMDEEYKRDPKTFMDIVNMRIPGFEALEKYGVGRLAVPTRKKTKAEKKKEKEEEN